MASTVRQAEQSPGALFNRTVLALPRAEGRIVVPGRLHTRLPNRRVRALARQHQDPGPRPAHLLRCGGGSPATSPASQRARRKRVVAAHRSSSLRLTSAAGGPAGNLGNVELWDPDLKAYAETLQARDRRLPPLARSQAARDLDAPDVFCPPARVLCLLVGPGGHGREALQLPLHRRPCWRFPPHAPLCVGLDSRSLTLGHSFLWRSTVEACE